QKIEQKRAELYTLSQSVDLEMQELLLKSFRPLIHKILADMGYKSAADLPILSLLQNTVWKNLINGALPELLMTHYGKLETMVHDTTAIIQERTAHAESIKNRYQDDELVEAIRPYAKFAVKSAESLLAINAKKF